MAKRGKVKVKVEPRESVERPLRSRKYRYLMLIVCEDQNTERVYFEQFNRLFNALLPSETVYVKAVGTGRNSLGVVMCFQRCKSTVMNRRPLSGQWH